MKAGAFTPAIPASRQHQSRTVRQRSMKAGAFTPAILPELLVGIRDTLRSMKAGAFTPAILQASEPPAGVFLRSMKAGAFTPAIRGCQPLLGLICPPLNEGGGFHPRNPCVRMGLVGGLVLAQ